MSKLQLLVKRGWQVSMYFQHSDKFFYLTAEHETGEANVNSGSDKFDDALNDLYSKAIAATPQWYLHQLTVS